MATRAQIKANRSNARKSTEPRYEEGKNRVSKTHSNTDSSPAIPSWPVRTAPTSRANRPLPRPIRPSPGPASDRQRQFLRGRFSAAARTSEPRFRHVKAPDSLCRAHSQCAASRVISMPGGGSPAHHQSRHLRPNKINNIGPFRP